MAKTGGRRTGKRYSPPQSAPEQVENRPPAPTLPIKPLTVRDGKKAAPLAIRSRLSVGFSIIRPTWRNYIEYVDLAARNGNENMARYRDCYLSLSPKDRRTHWPEQLCDLANVTPKQLVEAVCGELWDSGAAESSMFCAVAHPQVLHATAKFAQLPTGQRDRELFLRATGSLPDRQGTSINIFNRPTAQAGEVKLASEAGALKSMDEEVIEMTRQLDAPEGAPFLVKQDVPLADH